MIGQTEFPTVCPVEDIPAYVAAAERFVAQLTTVRQIKSSGTWPIFAKPFQRFPAPLIRRALVLILRACQQIAPAARSLNRIPIPDMIRGDAERLNVAMASALPQCRIIAVFRHPCGHIASVKRGPGLYDYGPLVLATTRARELGFTQEHYEDYRKSSVGFTGGLSCMQNCSKKHQGLRTSGSFDTRTYAVNRWNGRNRCSPSPGCAGTTRLRGS